MTSPSNAPYTPLTISDCIINLKMHDEEGNSTQAALENAELRPLLSGFILLALNSFYCIYFELLSISAESQFALLEVQCGFRHIELFIMIDRDIFQSKVIQIRL